MHTRALNLRVCYISIVPQKEKNSYFVQMMHVNEGMCICGNCMYIKNSA